MTQALTSPKPNSKLETKVDKNVSKNTLSAKVKKQLNKDENGDFATILKEIKAIKHNILNHKNTNLKQTELDNKDTIQDIDPAVILDLNQNGISLLQINNAKQKLQNLLEQIKTTTGFKQIKNISDLIEYANKKGLNIQKLDIKILKKSLNNPDVKKQKISRKDTSISKKAIKAKTKQIELVNKKIVINTNNIIANTKDNNKTKNIKNHQQKEVKLENILNTIKQEKQVPDYKQQFTTDNTDHKLQKSQKVYNKSTIKSSTKIAQKDVDITILDNQAPIAKIKTDISDMPKSQLSYQKQIKNEQILEQNNIQQESLNIKSQQKTEKNNIINNIQNQALDKIDISPKYNIAKNTQTKHKAKANIHLSSKIEKDENMLKDIFTQISTKDIQDSHKNKELDYEVQSNNDTILDKNDFIVKKDDILYKAKDIKQTFRNFAKELKEKIDDYKPPIMKLSISLKPLNLGKINITLLSRGDNIKVHINSSSTSMNMIMQNITEFKNTLTQAGINNLDMSFNSNTQQNAHHHQQEQNQTKYTYQEVSQEEEILEAIDEIEFSIPKYT